MEPLDGRVIVATFASNIARIQQVLDAAADMGRKVAVIGRSMEQNFRIATDLGYLTYDPSRIVAKDRIKDMPDDKLVIATTGAQGEPMAGLARMANRDHRFVEIQPGDTVIVSASPIPGNEEYVSRTIDNLFKAGANVYYHTIKRAHVSGHASQEELKLMLGLTKPKHFIPIHGEFRMQVQHGRLAIETGVAPENVFIIENGMPIELYADGSARRGAPVTAGYVYVDGLSVGDVGDVVLRDRRALASDGIFMIVVTVDKQTGSIVGRPGDHHPRVRPPERARPDHGRGARARHAVHRYAGRPHQRDRPAQDPDQGRRLALPVRADQATADGLPRRRRGLSVATRRDPRPSRTTRRTRRRRTRTDRSRCRSSTTRSSERSSRHHAADRRRRHAHRPRAPEPGQADRLVARLDRAVVRQPRAALPDHPPRRWARGSSGAGQGPGGGGGWSRRSWHTPASWGSSGLLGNARFLEGKSGGRIGMFLADTLRA